MGKTELSAYAQGLLDASAIEANELNLIAILSPKVSVDGDMYCWLLGDNLQDGVAGFGKSPYLAALDFKRAFYANLPEARS